MVILILENFIECKFREQPKIWYDSDTRYFSTNSVNGWQTTHTTKKAVKSAIRRENAVIGQTPRYKWVKPELI